MVRVPSAKVVGRHPTSPSVYCTSVITAVLHHQGPLLAGPNVFFLHLHSCSIRLLHSTRHTTWKNNLFHKHGDQKNFKNSKTKNRHVHTHSSSPITTTFASYSRSFATLLACCERRRLRFNTISYDTSFVSQGGTNTFFGPCFFFPVGPPMMYRTHVQ